MLGSMIPFLVGLSGIVAFAVFRSFESRTGERFLDGKRKQLDAITLRLYRASVRGELPTTYRRWVADSLRHVAHSIVTAIVSTLRKTERSLSQISHQMRTPRTRNGEARDPSAYLKTITPEEGRKKRGEEPKDSV